MLKIMMGKLMESGHLEISEGDRLTFGNNL
jgi:hypothetical protein